MFKQQVLLNGVCFHPRFSKHLNHEKTLYLQECQHTSLILAWMIALVNYAHISSLSSMASLCLWLPSFHIWITLCKPQGWCQFSSWFFIRETSKGGAVCDPASLLQKTEKGRSTRSRGYAKPEWKVSPWHPFPSSGIPYQHHNAKGKVLLYTIRINRLSVDILIHIYIYTYVKKI